LVDWSVNFRNFINRRFNKPQLKNEIIKDKFMISKLNKGVWGSKLWKLLHIFACISDFSNKCIEYTAIVTCLPHIIPCPECQIHFLRHIKEFPLNAYIYNRDIFQWSLDVHNATNKIILDKINKTKKLKGELLMVYKPFTRIQANREYYDLVKKLFNK
jgi:hypothetical protein